MRLEAKSVQEYVDRSLPVIAAVATFLILILPDLAPALSDREGYVWSPVNALQWQIGDMYYYAAWVREAHQGSIPPINPTAGELADRPSIEVMKSASIIMAAVPTLFFSDFRVGLLVSYGLFPALTMLAGYFVARSFTTSRFLATLAAFTMPFFYMVLLKSGLENIELARWQNFNLPDEISSSFRFVNSSVAFFISIVFVLLLLGLARTDTRPRLRIAAVVAAGLVVGFSYPPQAAAVYLFMGFYAVCLFAVGLRRPGLRVLMSGLTIVVILLLIDYKGIVAGAAANTQFFSGIFSAGETLPALWTRDGFVRVFAKLFDDLAIKRAFFNFAFFGVIGGLVVRRRPGDLAAVLALCAAAAAFLVACLITDNKLYPLRFLGRGLAPIWYLIVFTVILDRARINAEGLYRRVASPAYRTRMAPAAPWLKYIAVLVVLAFPINSFARHGDCSDHSAHFWAGRGKPAQCCG
ncbi:MAG: hypothetical protein AAF850_13815, partial [Pseudomonadota bacterium]